MKDSNNSTADQKLISSIKSLIWQEYYLLGQVRKANITQQSGIAEVNTRSQEMGEALGITREHIKESAVDTSQMLQSLNDLILLVETGISENLAEIGQELDEKSNSVVEIMGVIQDIGYRLNLLSFNAGIEAAHAGKAGKGFAIVAQEVRKLATGATEHTRDVSTHLNLEQIQKSLTKVKTEAQVSMALTKERLGKTVDDLQDRFVQMEKRLESVEEINHLLFEVLGLGGSALNHAIAKSDWSRSVLADLLAMPENDPTLTAKHLQKLLSRNQITAAKDQDRLTQILECGILRVAVEPSFVGLSFRQNLGSELIGMDIEYARALAKWLGVKCEFIEYPWDLITELLTTGPKIGEKPVDIVCSALPPSSEYENTAYSETYSYLHFALARRKGDSSINSLADLDGKVLGIINDPGATIVLEQEGVRWEANEKVPGGKVRLSNLIAFNDQSRIHDCLVEGLVDAFAVDLPIYYWACNDKKSPWYGKIELLPGNIASDPYYYTIAVAEEASSYTLMKEINRFITSFKQQPEREEIECYWQGKTINHTLSYRDEADNIHGEGYLRELYQKQ